MGMPSCQPGPAPAPLEDAHMWFRLSVLSLILGVGSPGVAAAQNEHFPNTKEWGRAAIQYRDGQLHLVAAYYYSQIEHDSRWMMIETAFTTEELSTIPRSAFHLLTPDDRRVELATQRDFNADHPRVRQLVQNANLSRHDVISYFNRRGRVEPFRFFTVPSGRTVQEDVQADQFRGASGDLFFQAPLGSWPAGIYTLVLEHEQMRAAVPIELR